MHCHIDNYITIYLNDYITNLFNKTKNNADLSHTLDLVIFANLARRTNSRIQECRVNYYYNSAIEEKWKLANSKLHENLNTRKSPDPQNRVYKIIINVCVEILSQWWFFSNFPVILKSSKMFLLSHVSFKMTCHYFSWLDFFTCFLLRRKLLRQCYMMTHLLDTWLYCFNMIGQNMNPSL